MPEVISPEQGQPNNAAANADPAAAAAQADLISKAEAQKAFRARDEAKKEAKRAQAMFSALAGRLGIDADALELVETGNAENPFELKGEPVESLVNTLSEAQKAKLEKQKKTGDWDTREKEINAGWQQKLAKALADADAKVKSTETGLGKQTAAMRAWIEEQAVTAPLREALAAENAVHDGKGNFGVLVDALDKRIKREIAIDEETGRVSVKLTPLGDDGLPITDGKGGNGSMRDLVAEFLGKNPQFKQSNFRRGPGAGGFAPPGMGGQPAKQMTAADRGLQAGASIFGPQYVPGYVPGPRK